MSPDAKAGPKTDADTIGTLHHEGTRYVLRFERRLAHSPEKIWRALTEAGELQHWFPAAIEGAREPGAKLRFVFPGEGTPEEQKAQAEYEGVAGAMDGEMLVYDPPRALEFSWAGEILRFELQPQEAHTLLVFTHSFDEEGKAARDASGWEVCLGALAHRLGGRDMKAYAPEGFRELFDAYARRFGPKASARKMPDAG